MCHTYIKSWLCPFFFFVLCLCPLYLPFVCVPCLCPFPLSKVIAYMRHIICLFVFMNMTQQRVTWSWNFTPVEGHLGMFGHTVLWSWKSCHFRHSPRTQIGDSLSAPGGVNHKNVQSGIELCLDFQTLTLKVHIGKYALHLPSTPEGRLHTSTSARLENGNFEISQWRGLRN